jgi:5'-3' exonuclease
MNVHLVDGTFELFRAYYGAPGAKSPSGVEVGATRGLLRSFAALLREDDCTHIAVAFDTRIESFRNELFDGYKTGEGIEPELFAQFPLAERAAAALGMVVWPMIEFEADDGLAAGAARFVDEPGVGKVIICSPDKDLTQCVRDPKVVTFDRIRGTMLDEAGVCEKFGVGPASIPDYLGLRGDAQDGIPGIARWGAKSAATVLAHYEHIENIPDDESDWEVKVRGAAGLAKNLREHREAALLYKKLAVLRTDVPITDSLDDLRWRGARRDELAAFCEEIGQTGLLERIATWR